jgi:hypothetical protein
MDAIIEGNDTRDIRYTYFGHTHSKLTNELLFSKLSSSIGDFVSPLDII